MGALPALLARWRADRGLLLLLVAVVAVTAGVVASVPRLLDSLARASLEDTVADTVVSRSGVAATTVRSLDATDPDLAREQLDRAGQLFSGAIDAPLREVLGAGAPVVDSIRYDLSALPGDTTDALLRKLTIRVQDDLDGHVELVEGRLPDGVPQVQEVAFPARGAAPEVVPLTVHEFVVTRVVADALAMEIGDRRLGDPDATGPVLSRLVVPTTRQVVFELSGIVELSDPREPVWFADPRLHRPSVFDTGTSTTFYTFGILPLDLVGEFPDGRAAAGEQGQPQAASVGMRWQLDADALLDADREAVERAALTLRTTVPTALDQPRFQTGLDRLLATERARRATATEVLGLVGVAVTGVAAALLVAVAQLLAARRRDGLTLARGRGASRSQVLLASLVESALVSVLGGLLGALAVRLVLGPGDGDALAIAVAAAATLLLAGSVVGHLRRSLGDLLAERRRPRAARAGRHVLDGVLVLVAGIAILGLRRRGVVVDGTTDPLVMAAPVLVALAVAVLVARLVPYPLRALDVLVRRRQGLAVPVGVAQSARRPGAGPVVVLVVLGLGVAVMAASLHRSLEAGRARASFEQVGADVRVDAAPLGSLPADVELPGDVAADVSIVDGGIVADDGAQRLDVLVVDAEAFDVVSADGDVPSLHWDGVGPAPIVLSSILRSAGSPEVGADVTVQFDTGRVAARVAAILPRVAGSDERDGVFAVVPRAAVTAATGMDPPVTRRLVATDDPAAVRADAVAQEAGTDVVVRAEVEAALAGAPLSRGVAVGFVVAAAAALAATALAVVLALAAAAPQRRRHGAVLAALGTPSATVRSTLLVEVVPTVLVAAVVGVGVAAGLATLLDGRLDLAPFTGTADPTALVLAQPWLVVVLVLAAGAVTSAASVLTLGRVDPGTLLREGD